MPTAFITGCASGFGHALCARLLAEGWHVVATDPEIDGLERALAPDSATRERLLVLRMDLASSAQIRGAVYEAVEWSPVDLLVNNGGYAVFATQEEGDLGAIEKMFAVNVFGAMHLTRALLPTLRARRGAIVQISSVAGRMVFPESGFYAATKHAIEALSEALYLETCTFGLRVRVVEPGSFATRFLERAQAHSEPRRPSSPYAHLHPAWDEAKRSALEPPQDPALVVDAIVRSLDDPRGFLRVPVGADGARIIRLRERLSHDGWVKLMAERSGLPPIPTANEEWLAPAEVLALGAAEDTRLDATLAVFHAGHLDHWAQSEEGRAALAALAALAERAQPATPAPAPLSADVLALARALSDPQALTAAAQAAAEAVERATRPAGDAPSDTPPDDPARAETDAPNDEG